MNEEYKQWKKWLADPRFITGLAVAIFLLVTAVFDFLYNTFALFGKSMEGANFSSLSYSFSLFSANFKSQFWRLLLPSFSSGIFMALYFLLFLVVGIFSGFKLYQMRRAFRDLNKGSKGTSRWTTLEEIDKQYKKISIDKDDEFDGPPGFPVCMNPDRKHVYIDTDNTNAKVVGGTQSGKTQIYSYGMLDINIRSKQPNTMVVNDIKGDMLRRVWFHPMAQRKFNIAALNLINPKNSVRYNPLYTISRAYWKDDFAEAQRALKSVSYILFHNPESKDPVWDLGAQAVFEAVVWLICQIAHENDAPQWVNMTAVIDFIIYLTQEEEKDKSGRSILTQYIEKLPSEHQSKKFYMTAQQGAKNQVASFNMIVSSKLNLFTSESIKYLTSGHDVDFVNLGYPEDGKPTLLFVVFPYTDNSNEVLLNLFYTQLYQSLSVEQTNQGKAFDTPVFSWLEEFPNIPAISNIEKYANVGLQGGMKYAFFYQSKTQVEDVYGDKKSKAILNAAGNSVFIMSDEKTDAEDFSADLGERTYIKENRSGDPLDSNKSYTEDEDGRRLIMGDELRRLVANESVLNRSKKRKDLKGRDVRPYPIGAFKKRIKGSNGEETFEDWMNLKPAFEYLFIEAGGYFDDQGKGMNQIDLRQNLEKDEDGNTIDRVLRDEDLIIDHDVIDELVSVTLGGNNERPISGRQIRGVTPAARAGNPSLNDRKRRQPPFQSETKIEALNTIKPQNEKKDSPLIEDIFDLAELQDLIVEYFDEGVAAYASLKLKKVSQMEQYLRQQMPKDLTEREHEFEKKLKQIQKKGGKSY